MSGLTDKQFETVCDLADRAATVELNGQPTTDVRNLPKLLEELLAAARRGLTHDPTSDGIGRNFLADALKEGMVAHSDIEDAPVNELGPENGRAICHWDAKVTEMVCEHIRQNETTGGES